MDEEELWISDKGKDAKLSDVINDEELLYICMELVNLEDGIIDPNAESIAGRVVTMEAIKRLSKTKETFTATEVSEETGIMLLNHTLDAMVKKGLIEEFLDGYSLTELGEKIVEEL